MSNSGLEAYFEAIWPTLAAGLPVPEREHPFGRYRFDFAWPKEKVVLEIHGGDRMARSGHNTAAGMARDHRKQAAAVLAGWTYFCCTGSMLKDNPQEVVDWLVKALQRKGANSNG